MTPPFKTRHDARQYYLAEGYIVGAVDCAHCLAITLAAIDPSALVAVPTGPVVLELECSSCGQTGPNLFLPDGYTGEAPAAAPAPSLSVLALSAFNLGLLAVCFLAPILLLLKLFYG